MDIKLADFKIGLGTWMLGEKKEKYQSEYDALNFALQNGVALIDTAEMYGDGKSESFIGEVIKQYDRKKLFIVSKVYPHNASLKKMENSCINSLKRLGIQYLDLYLLHWRGSVPLSETVEAFEALKSKGYIKNWGVSNFDTTDMQELWDIPNGKNCITNQVLYNIDSRGIEYDLIPWLHSHNVNLMAYSPLASNEAYRKQILHSKSVLKVAEKHNVTPYQVMLAFAARHKNSVAIPRTSSLSHMRENISVINLHLDSEDLALIDTAFPPPNKKQLLDII